ncbi:hypothetical protein ACFX2F_025901 [Malus domestica]
MLIYPMLTYSKCKFNHNPQSQHNVPAAGAGQTTFGNSSSPSANFTPAGGVGVRDFEELQTLWDVSFDGRESELRIAGAAKVSAEGLNLRYVSFDGGGKFPGVDAAACVLQPLKAASGSKFGAGKKKERKRKFTLYFV